jgi:hypothetical protein
MTYPRRLLVEWRDGKLYGWTGKTCARCNGRGESYHDSTACGGCDGTGEEWGLMPAQPDDGEVTPKEES